jgi:RimJ/RimL family protein N-acetyltransferase
VATFADKPTLRGERVVLRPIVAADSASMWSDLADEEARRLTGTTRTFTRDEIDEWCATRGETDDRWDLAVVDAATGEWLGEAVINDWEPDRRSCGFRIALGPNARDRGIGTEATRLVVDAVFDLIDDPPVHRLGLEVYAFNPRAIAVYERVGFRREGVLRDALRWNGDHVDAIVMSILRTDRV